MKLKYLLPAAMLAASFSASAVPAYPGLIQRTLEDGSTVMVRIHGDEYFSYLTDEQGFMLESKNNVLNYSLQNGQRIQATQAVINDLRAQSEISAPAQMMRADVMQRMATLNSVGQTNFSSIGDVNFCVLLVQYADKKFNSPTIREDMNEMLNGEGYTKNGCKGSVREYYMNSSNNQFRPTFDVSEVITLPQTSSYYTQNEKYGNVRELVKTAVELADPTVDFSKYANMTPGECDVVIIFFAGYGQADTSDTSCIWPHQSSVKSDNVIADKTTIASYCIFNELNGGQHYHTGDGAIAGIGTPIHEFGHVMGLPDLYDPAYVVKSTPGQWSVFDMGPYLGDGYCPPAFSSYERYVMRWLDPEDLVENTHYELEDLNTSNRALRQGILDVIGQRYSKEYWLLETRSKTGWDEYLPGEGMLIWHVDFNPSNWTYNSVNSTESRKRCHIITADGSANYDLNKTNATSANAAWPYDKNYLTPESDIRLEDNYNRSTGNVDAWITGIDYNSGITQLDYNVFKEFPAITSVMLKPVKDVDDHGREREQVVLSWEPVDGATGYALTMYRKSGTRIIYESNLNETIVGNTTTYTVPLTRNKMAMEYYAYVRPLIGLPSTEKSNEVVFVPNNLEKATTGINGIEAEDAEVTYYNLQGVRVDNPSNGIFIRRQGTTVTKVVL